MVEDLDEELGVKLKCSGKLRHNLPRALDELLKDRRSLIFLHRVIPSMTTPFLELMSDGEPFLFNEHDEALHGPIVRVQAELHQTAKLRGSVPSIRAMAQNGALLHRQTPNHHHRPFEQFPNMTQPLGAAQQLEPLLISRRSQIGVRVNQIRQSLSRFAHNVNVLDVQKLQNDVFIKIRVFESAASHPVCSRIQLWPRVHDIQSVRKRVRLCDRGNEVLVSSRSIGSHRHFGLRAPKQCHVAIRRLPR